MLPYTTWFFIGDEEAELLFNVLNAKQVEAYPRNYGFVGQGVVVKCGSAGATASVGGEMISVDAWLVLLLLWVLGMGFNAGFLAGILRGWTLSEALTLGSLVGAYAVTSFGDYFGYPTWAEAKQTLYGKEKVNR